jgi:hypothetical protein
VLCFFCGATTTSFTQIKYFFAARLVIDFSLITIAALVCGVKLLFDRFAVLLNPICLALVAYGGGEATGQQLQRQ